MSVRTLSRRLSKEDLKFAEVLEQLRSDLALRYLGEPSLSISQIALVRTRESAMADRKNLGIIGCILSGAAAVVIGVSIFVVQGHLNGRYSLDDPRSFVSASSPTIAR